MTLKRGLKSHHQRILRASYVCLSLVKPILKCDGLFSVPDLLIVSRSLTISSRPPLFADTLWIGALRKVMLSARGFSAAIAILLALVALLVANRPGGQGEEIYTPPVQGANNTVLFIVLPHHGFSNVHLATSQALVERHPGIKQHYASFPLLEKKVQRLSQLAIAKRQGAQAIDFHALTSGRDYIDILAERLNDNSSEAHISPPGLQGIDELCGRMELYLSPWPAEEYMDLYREMTALIHRIDPAVVVLDHQFVIAMDAARQNNRLHAVISPNEPLDMFAGVQPRGGFFWKYPVVGSGISFPVPWSQVPTNMYLAFRLVSKALNMKGLKEKRKYFEQHGLTDSFDILKLYRKDTPIIFPSMQGANVPLDFIPQNVSEVGPIVLSVATAAEQDRQLYAWLEQAPTVLINLGSTVEYTKPKAIAMADAIKQILDQSTVQILWKLNKGDGYVDKDMRFLQTYVADGRLKIESWLSVDPTSLLESGHVVAFVHHGGANCYHESVFGGVAHVVLPLWADLYNFAAMVEPLGIGLWACSQSPLIWTGVCISDAVLQVIANNDKGKAIREKARLLGAEARKMPGRYGSADIVAKLAGSGKA